MRLQTYRSDAMKGPRRPPKDGTVPCCRYQSARFFVERIAPIWTFAPLVLVVPADARCCRAGGKEMGTIVAAADCWSTSRNDLIRWRVVFDQDSHGHCRRRDEPMELARWRLPLPPGSAHVAVASFSRMAMLSRLTQPRCAGQNRESRQGKVASNRQEMVI